MRKNTSKPGHGKYLSYISIFNTLPATENGPNIAIFSKFSLFMSARILMTYSGQEQSQLSSLVQNPHIPHHTPGVM